MTIAYRRCGRQWGVDEPQLLDDQALDEARGEIDRKGRRRDERLDVPVVIPVVIADGAGELAQLAPVDREQPLGQRLVAHLGLLTADQPAAAHQQGVEPGGHQAEGAASR